MAVGKAPPLHTVRPKVECLGFERKIRFSYKRRQSYLAAPGLTGEEKKGRWRRPGPCRAWNGRRDHGADFDHFAFGRPVDNVRPLSELLFFLFLFNSACYSLYILVGFDAFGCAFDVISLVYDALGGASSTR